MKRQILLRLERGSAILGTVVFGFLFVDACVAHEFTARDACFFAAIAGAFGYAWFRLQKSS
jgi:hypothetical protein